MAGALEENKLEVRGAGSLDPPCHGPQSTPRGRHRGPLALLHYQSCPRRQVPCTFLGLSFHLCKVGLSSVSDFRLKKKVESYTEQLGIQLPSSLGECIEVLWTQFYPKESPGCEKIENLLTAANRSVPSQQQFMKCLLCAKGWGYSSEQNRQKSLPSGSCQRSNE